MTIDLRCGPMEILSRALRRCVMLTTSLRSLAASSAPSLTKFSKSAPEKPTVALATVCRFNSLLLCGTRFMYIWRICSRPLMSGSGTNICRSKRPGRSRAGSRMSSRLVAPNTTMPRVELNPSISVSIWLSVCEYSRPPPDISASRRKPMLSISSINTMHGAFDRALLKRSLTLLAPCPTYSSTNSDPDAHRKGVPASLATARASCVLPVPGGPTSRTPLGSFAPSLANFMGSRKNSTTSCSSSLASSIPAMSLNLTPCVVVLALMPGAAGRYRWGVPL
mmetsp:Transcript_15105/g.35942  ORF Transcript_15105/g.35942 Transcript_15105/m.35942 type:complete len:279 (+) Transcript_15105:657-1493(+)